LLIALFGVSLINAAFFGCTMRPATAAVSTGGSGSVACYSGVDNNAGTDVNTMACEFIYKNLTTDPTLCHFHVGSDNTTAGPVVFTFLLTSQVAAGGTLYQKFVASNTATWSQQGSTSFDAQVTACASGDNCYFNLHTGTYGGGELRCNLQPLSTLTYDYTVTLAPTAGTTNTSSSTGTATVQMATITPAASPAVHACGYQVSFTTVSPITLSHIHQGTTQTDNNGPAKVFLDHGPQRTSGKFCGVAVEGVSNTDQPASAWPSYAPDFDTAITNHNCYVNLHTVANPGGELRANLAPLSGGSSSGASQVSLAILAAFFIIASWMSL